jgi:glycosyltransferase involved in cell wall biosynthesis
MQQKLLTIVIPTFNRSRTLAVLLEVLTQQLAGLQDLVEVIVGDNASTDATPAVVEAFCAAFPAVTAIRHEENLGPDENFCRCLDRVATRFFWMIGDDDLPKVGVVTRVIDWLRNDDPDLLYLGSEWLPHLTSSSDGVAVVEFAAPVRSREDFAREVHVWVTFISCMVVNMVRLRELNPDVDLRRFAGTNLVQLGWVLPMLMSGSRFQICPQPCMLATSGNTGGYKLLTVFGTNLPQVLDQACGAGSSERRIIVSQLAWRYMPHLLWMSRFDSLGSFVPENAQKALAPLRSSPAYWLLLLPLAWLPKSLAWSFLRASRAYLRLARAVRRIRGFP